MITNHGCQRVNNLYKKHLIETLLGAAVIFSAVAFLIFTFNRTQDNIRSGEDSLTLYADFSSADGLKVGSDVRLAGVKIGSISAIELDKADFIAIATLQIFEDLLIPDDSEAVVISEGLLGQKYISINAGGSPTNLLDKDSFLYTQGSVDIFNLLSKFSGKSN